MPKLPTIHINSESEEQDYLRNHKTNLHIKIMFCTEMYVRYPVGYLICPSPKSKSDSVNPFKM